MQHATQRLEAAGCTDTPGLDAEVLLAHVLDRSRAYLMCHPEAGLESSQLDDFERFLIRRGKGEPVAYLTGRKEFWSMTLEVNPSVLIPRPDTELLVQRCLEHCDGHLRRIADLGTGSGAVALALASEMPSCQIVATDQSREAVLIARLNASALELGNVSVRYSDWFEALGEERFDLIVANPPYIDSQDKHLSGEVRFEPRDALVAGNHGLADLTSIISSAPGYLFVGGWLLVEHGFDQGRVVRELFSDAGFHKVGTFQDLGGYGRVTEGKCGYFNRTKTPDLVLGSK